MGNEGSTSNEQNCELAGEWVATRHSEWKNRNIGSHSMRARMPHTKMTYGSDGNGEGWVGDVYVHVSATTLAPGQFEARARIKALLWQANDGNLTTLHDGTLEVRYPSNGILEYWKRKAGSAVPIPVAHPVPSGPLRPIKLMFRRVDSLGITWHWAICIGDSIYETGGSMAVIGPRGVVHASSPLVTSKVAQTGTRPEQFDGYVDRGWTSAQTDAEVEQFCTEWVNRHPMYDVRGPNCQTFAEDLFIRLTGQNLEFSKFADLKRGPEASANAVWLNPSKKPF